MFNLSQITLLLLLQYTRGTNLPRFPCFNSKFRVPWTVPPSRNRSPEHCDRRARRLLRPLHKDPLPQRHLHRRHRYTLSERADRRRRNVSSLGLAREKRCCGCSICYVRCTTNPSRLILVLGIDRRVGFSAVANVLQHQRQVMER